MRIGVIIGLVLLAIIIYGAARSNKPDSTISPTDMLRKNDPLNPDYQLDRIRDRERYHRERGNGS
jgi:hypothetical protein